MKTRPYQLEAAWCYLVSELLSGLPLYSIKSLLVYIENTRTRSTNVELFQYSILVLKRSSHSTCWHAPHVLMSDALHKV